MRHEITVALVLRTTVIPVLVGGAKMPAGNLLPAEMAPLSLCQAVEIRDNCFDEDAGCLVEFLAGGPDVAPLQLQGFRMRRNVLLALIGMVAAAAYWRVAARLRESIPQEWIPESIPAVVLRQSRRRSTASGSRAAEARRAPFKIRLNVGADGRSGHGSGPVSDRRRPDS